MIFKAKFTFPLLLGLFAISLNLQSPLLGEDFISSAVAQPANNTITTPIASPFNGPTDRYPAFTFNYPSDWQKQEILNLVSPSVGVVGASELINVVTEVLPTFNYSLANYTEAAMSQVEVFQDFSLLNSSSTTLAGLPAHMIIYTYTDETQAPLQNLQIWTVNDGVAYIITYGGVPREFESSLPVLQTVLDTFALVS